MPKLKWNEYEFVECLSVLPEVDEYETGHHFKVEKDGIVLLISVRQYDSLFEISLSQTGRKNPLISFNLSVRGEVRFINDKRGSYLSFEDCSIVSTEFPITKSIDFLMTSKKAEKQTMALEIEPQIRIRFI